VENSEKELVSMTATNIVFLMFFLNIVRESAGNDGAVNSPQSSSQEAPRRNGENLNNSSI